MKLYTFTISHFSEKARWALDAAGLDYTEVPLVPGLHMPRTLWLSRRGTTVPILEADGQRIQDSTRIIDWLAEQRPAFAAALLPKTAKARADVAAIEARYDAIGRAVLTLVYQPLLEDPALLLRLWTLDARPLERALLRRVLPTLSIGLRRSFGISPRGIARAHAVLASALDELDAALADGRRVLVGKRFGIADLTVCALLAPLVAPDQHPVYGSALCRSFLPRESRDWAGRPAFAWVRDTYRDFRPEPKPGSAFAAVRAKLDA